MRSIILHDIRSLHNVGSIFRTADGAGWDMVYLTGFTPTPPRREISKTALGAETTVPWEYYEQIDELLEKLRGEGVEIVAIETGDETLDYRTYPPPEKLAVIMGNEVEGIDRDTLEKCDKIISLPMRGMKVSLNVSITAGVVMYEWMSRKNS